MSDCPSSFCRQINDEHVRPKSNFEDVGDQRRPKKLQHRSLFNCSVDKKFKIFNLDVCNFTFMNNFFDAPFFPPPVFFFIFSFFSVFPLSFRFFPVFIFSEKKKLKKIDPGSANFKKIFWEVFGVGVPFVQRLKATKKNVASGNVKKNLVWVFVSQWQCPRRPFTPKNLKTNW